jgi:hypothetical protein
MPKPLKRPQGELESLVVMSKAAARIHWKIAELPQSPYLDWAVQWT